MTADKGGDDRDPFEDLDDFFAPIEEAEEPEDLPASPRPREPEPPPAEKEVSDEDAAEALEGLELGIDLPDESDLVEGTPEEQEEAPPPPAAEEDADTGDFAAAEGVPDADDEPGGEWDRLRAEALAGSEGEAPEPEAEMPEPTAIPEAGTEAAGYPGLPGEDTGVEVVAEEEAAAAAEFADVGTPGEPQPDPEALQAAEHFASGMRESPEDIERSLLADLTEEGGSETVRIEPPLPPISEGPTWQEGGQPVGGEGPTWQEGGHSLATEEAPAEAPAGARNVPAALVSGVLLGAAVLALLAINKGAFLVLATAAILLAQAEIYAVMRTRGLQPATLLGLVCGGFTVVGAYLHGPDAALLGVALAMGLTVPWYMAAPVNVRQHTTANAAATILGVVYVPFLASFAMLLLAFPGDAGRYAFLAMLVLTVLYDVSAYAVGTLRGRRPMAPTISPNKSWEGAIGATLITVFVGLTVIPNFTPFNIGDNGAGIGVGLALVIAVMAPLGDLVESAFKRDLGVKDMGSLLPGHGGVLDRIDAILFAAPAAYFFLRIALT